MERGPVRSTEVPDTVTTYEQPHADRRDLLPQHAAYACTNCGHWQRWPSVPSVCPVCADVRNALPDGDFAFATTEEVEALLTCSWGPTACEGITEFRCEPRFGLDSRGWVVESDIGLVGFECAPWYSPAALHELRRRGGLAVLASSHVHGYGALWHLQQQLDPPVVSVGVRDLLWTKAFRVTWPADDELVLAPDLVLHRTGGHFDGHSVLHDSRRGVLFCGDSLKVDLDASGRAVALSAHKAFHAQIPLSHGELRDYRAVVSRLQFGTVFTPFEGAPVDTDQVIRLVDRLLSGPPSAGPVPLVELR